ncbi:MAG: hypothetical protein ACMUIE_02160 [Thermoplasmatota archaeon]
MNRIPILFAGAAVILFICGCLGSSGEEEGMSAFKHHPTVRTRVEQTGKELSLVVVTAVEPGSDGRAVKWKFAYNDVTSGFPLGSVAFTVSGDGSIEEETGEPLSKAPVRNWSVDSTSAVSTARQELTNRDYIEKGKDIHLTFLYLLGDKSDNGGCEWNIGIMPYYDDPTELLARIDGRSGDLIELKKILG